MKRILVIGETTNSLVGSGEYQCPSSSCDVEDPWSQGKIKVTDGLWQLADKCATADGSRSMTTSSNPMRRQHICTSAAWTGEWSHMPCCTQALGSRSMQLRNIFFSGTVDGHPRSQDQGRDVLRNDRARTARDQCAGMPWKLAERRCGSLCSRPASHPTG